MYISRKNILSNLLELFIIINSSLYLIITVFNNKYTINSNKVTAGLVLLLSIYLVLKSRKNIPLFIVSIFILYSNYSIVMSRYFIFFKSSMYKQITDIYIYGIGINILLAFIILLNILIRKKIYENKFGFYTHKNENIYIVMIISIILLSILIFGFSRPDIFGERGTPSPLYEYSTIFFILGFSYVGNNKKCKYLLLIILICFALQNLIFGGRIIALQLMFIFYFVFLYNKISMKTTIILIIPIFILMIAIGSFRGNILSSNNILSSSVDKIKDNMLTLDTAYAAYFTSLTFVYVKPIINIHSRLQMFGSFILSMFLGGAVPKANLASFTRNYIEHYNGGVIPYFFYFWFGWIGIAIPAFIVAKYFSIVKKVGSSRYWDLVALYFIITVPRWYLYTPIPLIRGFMLLTILYYGFKFADKLLKCK